MLPIHPNPKPGELLSSWMVRLALANGYCAHTFYKAVLGYTKEIWTRDIDCCATEELVEVLSNATGLDANAIRNLTYKSFEGSLFEHLNTHAKHRWIQPIGIRHRLHTYPGLQFCPKCLDEDVSYYRMNWRFSFYTFCPKHSCLLQNRCPACNNPISFHRVAIGKKREVPKIREIGICSFCGYQLNNSPIEHIDWRGFKSGRPYRFWLQDFDKAGASARIHPNDLYQGLWVISSWLANTRAKNASNGIAKELEISIPRRRLGSTQEVERFDIKERFNLFLATFWIMYEWPYRFKHFVEKHQVGKSSFEDYKGKIPTWMYEVVPH